ncbi:MAG: crossover junction endodeoxyribonuclease RuvC [Candidatus Omnitrophica bacterium]|nr:crossover junction endodeoxyribonuclease RuvC [Candidatus Omnitrophota bacterium]
MIILGIDPGLRITGLVVVEKNKSSVKIRHCQELNTQKIKNLSKKLEFLFSCLEKVIAKFRPDVIVVEKLYSHYRHPLTLASLAQVRGIIFLVASRKNINLVEYSSTKVKKIITSYGSASKDQMRKMVAYLSGLDRPLKSEHISDALGLVLTYLYYNKK